MARASWHRSRSTRIAIEQVRGVDGVEDAVPMIQQPQRAVNFDFHTGALVANNPPPRSLAEASSPSALPPRSPKAVGNEDAQLDGRLSVYGLGAGAGDASSSGAEVLGLL